MAVSELDEIRVLWNTIAELQLEIEYADTGYIRTTINTLLEHLRRKELGLSEIDRVALALMFPNRWERDWCAVL
jgi:hypothetical protein